jgi:hypothetical protein
MKRRPRRQPPPELVFPLLAHLDGLMTDLAGRVPGALNEFDAEAIHQSRWGRGE